jgi:hypothetical protein
MGKNKDGSWAPNINQRAAMTRAFARHPDGCVVKVVTAKALEDRGMIYRPSPERRPGWIKMSEQGLEWAEKMGW